MPPHLWGQGRDEETEPGGDKMRPHTPWGKSVAARGRLKHTALHTAPYPPFEFLQGAGGMGMGGGRDLLRLQAVGKGVQVFDQQAHHQHVLLGGRE